MGHSLARVYLRWEVCSGERARSLCFHAGVSCEKGILQVGAKVSCLAGSAWERAYAGIILGSGVRLTYGLCRVPTLGLSAYSYCCQEGKDFNEYEYAQFGIMHNDVINDISFLADINISGGFANFPPILTYMKAETLFIQIMMNQESGRRIL